MTLSIRAAGRLSDRRRSFLLEVALGWALIPGPLAGSLFGTLSPIIFDLPVSSFAGGLLGLLIGPVVAAIEGIILVSAFSLVLRIVTGKPPVHRVDGAFRLISSRNGPGDAAVHHGARGIV